MRHKHREIDDPYLEYLGEDAYQDVHRCIVIHRRNNDFDVNKVNKEILAIVQKNEEKRESDEAKLKARFITSLNTGSFVQNMLLMEKEYMFIYVICNP